ncbi:hypothetical protein [Lactococcus garvieae]|uniref:hypothetical protein n=1 Tax=Lactococcus garvieae TaxID=1363 RepID=UPI003853F347
MGINFFSWEAISAISTMVGSIVLTITVFQLFQQNKRQNELDERQKKIEEREKYQIELNIKQSLFERRLSSWKIIKTLYLTIDNDLFDVREDDFDFPFLIYINLNNNYYLKDIQNAIRMDKLSDNTRSENQDSFLMKMNDMELLSDEITLLFSEEEGEQLSNFIISYKKLIISTRRYKLKMESIREQSEGSKEKLDKLPKIFQEEARRNRIYEQYTLLCEMHKNIKENNFIDELYKQIKFTK